MQRRTFLSLIAASGAIVGLDACTAAVPRSAPVGVLAPSAPASKAAAPVQTVPPISSPMHRLPVIEKVPIPAGVMTGLPGNQNLLAWTVDDGSNSEVIRLYAEFAKSTGTRLTFFLNGSYSGWTDNADLLRPLVQSGQIQLGNHTWSHADLTSLSDAAAIAELQRNHDFIVGTYGVDPRPYYRPPYGFRSARTDQLAASIGYTTPVLWYGTLSDSGLITEQQVTDFAAQWFLPEHIVIGHLNFLPVTNVFPALSDLIAARGLATVTLDDVFAR
ncbi:polysaccharide deacetylase family protein [Agreia pratensis]|uniref:Peptidoglycan/xylan/chitin deacetylase, PgdA/CDA1 family n=1 Tax=Agreia pratensis TaxID=150121 RepID=A0A1X7KL43_9MICO|nr:polysaccharide deacetylase family protein [Agreia pratensis]SMG41389.1 Peptidoglycan/xylan/chitin deacetylase, PgdA/CDA1 family [Agreia pratensis]